ncbi:MAG: aldolase [Acidobacteria bacterium]|nr:MAG: aldolase [Acidobacteriota bacterium]
MELCLITDKTEFAAEAEKVGIERIMLDLERTGKRKRQMGRDLFISDHIIASVPRMRAVLGKARLVVRVNPLSHKSCEEIDAVIEAGADFMMLPYFHSVDEVRGFRSLVAARAKTILLVETKSAVEILPTLVKERLGDEVHIGLNDLRISLGNRTIFDPLCNGMIERLSALLRGEKIPFGVGGIARLSHDRLPINPEHVLAEQVRLEAGIGWLGRSFREDMENRRRPGELACEVELIRKAINKWESAPEEALAANRKILREEVAGWEAAISA